SFIANNFFVAVLCYSILTIPCSIPLLYVKLCCSGFDGGRLNTVSHWYKVSVMSQKLVRCSLCIFLIFMSCKGLAEPSLQGTALHQELGQDQFLGALYTDIASDDVAVILDTRIAKRMELKVIARG